jgi:hypothetical protein
LNLDFQINAKSAFLSLPSLSSTLTLIQVFHQKYQAESASNGTSLEAILIITKAANP